MTRSDRMLGQVLGEVGALPSIYTKLEINFFLLRRLLGVKVEEGSKAKQKVTKLSKDEYLMVNVGSMNVGSRIAGVKGDAAKLELNHPVCTKVGEKVALSRRVEKHWRLIGWGTI